MNYIFLINELASSISVIFSDSDSFTRMMVADINLLINHTFNVVTELKLYSGGETV